MEKEKKFVPFEELMELMNEKKITWLEYVELNESYSDIWDDWVAKGHPRTAEEASIFLDKLEEELHGEKDHGMGVSFTY